MAFTYDVTTDRGLVRLQLADANESAYVFEDAEIDSFLSRGGTVDLATGLGFRVLYADATRRAKYIALPGMTLDNRTALDHFRAMITMYGADAPTVSVIVPGSDSDSGFCEPTTCTVC